MQRNLRAPAGSLDIIRSHLTMTGPAKSPARHTADVKFDIRCTPAVFGGSDTRLPKDGVAPRFDAVGADFFPAMRAVIASSLTQHRVPGEGPKGQFYRNNLAGSFPGEFQKSGRPDTPRIRADSFSRTFLSCWLGLASLRSNSNMSASPVPRPPSATAAPDFPRTPSGRPSSDPGTVGAPALSSVARTHPISPIAQFLNNFGARSLIASMMEA